MSVAPSSTSLTATPDRSLSRLAQPAPARSCCASSASTFDELLLREAPGATATSSRSALDGGAAVRTTSSASRAPRRASAGSGCSSRELPPRPVLGADTEVVLDERHLRQAARRRRCRARCSPAVRPHARRAHRRRAALAGRTSTSRCRHRSVTLRKLAARRDRALRRHRRAVRQGRRLRDPGARRRVHHAHRGQLFGRDGPAARRDGRAPRARSGCAVL